jgi:hypothetical protein
MFICCNLAMKWSKEMFKTIPPPIVWDKKEYHIEKNG